MSSTSPSDGPRTPASLRAIGRAFFENLGNTRDHDAVRALLHADAVVTHDSYPPARGADQFLTFFQKALEHMPDFHVDIKEIIAEVDEVRGAGGRVWVNSIVTGAPGGETKESIDIVTVDENGLVTESRDVQRVIAHGDKEAAARAGEEATRAMAE